MIHVQRGNVAIQWPGSAEMHGPSFGRGDGPSYAFCGPGTDFRGGNGRPSGPVQQHTTNATERFDSTGNEHCDRAQRYRKERGRGLQPRQSAPRRARKPRFSNTVLRARQLHGFEPSDKTDGSAARRDTGAERRRTEQHRATPRGVPNISRRSGRMQRAETVPRGRKPANTRSLRSARSSPKTTSTTSPTTSCSTRAPG